MSDYLYLTSQCNKYDVPVISQPQMVYVLTEVKPGAKISAARLPLNFALALDVSASMKGEKMHTVQQAVKNIIDQLEPDDMISIVSFESSMHVLIPIQPAVDKVALKAKVDEIMAAGGTQMAPALREALAQINQHNSVERISRIVLLTDGATSNPKSAAKAADEAGNSGVPIIGLGIGAEWKEDFIQDLCNRSLKAAEGSQAGYTDYIESPTQVNAIFQQVFRSMQVVATDVTLTLRLVTGMDTRSVWQIAPMMRDITAESVQERAVVIPAGTLDKSGSAYLCEILVSPRPAGVVRIAQTEASYTAPTLGKQRESVDLVLNFTQDSSRVDRMNPAVIEAVQKVSAYRLQNQALTDAKTGNVEGATKRLRQAVTMLIDQGETDLAEKMEQEAQNLEQTGNISSEGEKTIKLTSRKTYRLPPADE